MKPSDRYTLVRLLGAGGMGEVYLAEDSLLKRTVAIKKVRPASLGDMNLADRIGRECVLHAKVGSHPNIVSLYDRIDDDDEIMLVMEYVPGEPLRNYLEKRDEGVPLREAVTVTMQVLSALDAVHNLDIIHRDIKPENIMVVEKTGGELVAKLLDFGIARGGGQLSITSTAQGSPGTPKYMAPEQIDPDAFGRVSPGTDVYAVGIMLYELISGTTPFTGNFNEIMAGHLHRSIQAPQTRDGRAVPKEITAIIQKATARHPKDRYLSAREFSDALRRFAEKLSIPLSATEAATLPATTGQETIVVDLPPSVIAGTRPPPGRGNQTPQQYHTPPPQTQPGQQNPTPAWNPTPAINVPSGAVKPNRTNLIIFAAVGFFLFGIILIGVIVVIIATQKPKLLASNPPAIATPTAIPAAATPAVEATPIPLQIASPAPSAEPEYTPIPSAIPAATAVRATAAPTAAPTMSPVPATNVPPTAAATAAPTIVATADDQMINDIVRLKKLQTNVEKIYKEKSFDISKSIPYARGKRALSDAGEAARAGKLTEARTFLQQAEELLTAAEKDAKDAAW